MGLDRQELDRRLWKHVSIDVGIAAKQQGCHRLAVCSKVREDGTHPPAGTRTDMYSYILKERSIVRCQDIHDYIYVYIK